MRMKNLNVHTHGTSALVAAKTSRGVASQESTRLKSKSNTEHNNKLRKVHLRINTY